MHQPLPGFVALPILTAASVLSDFKSTHVISLHVSPPRDRLPSCLDQNANFWVQPGLPSLCDHIQHFPQSPLSSSVTCPEQAILSSLSSFMFISLGLSRSCPALSMADSFLLIGSQLDFFAHVLTEDFPEVNPHPPPLENSITTPYRFPSEHLLTLYLMTFTLLLREVWCTQSQAHWAH